MGPYVPKRLKMSLASSFDWYASPQLTALVELHSQLIGNEHLVECWSNMFNKINTETSERCWWAMCCRDGVRRGETLFRNRKKQVWALGTFWTFPRVWLMQPSERFCTLSSVKIWAKRVFKWEECCSIEGTLDPDIKGIRKLTVGCETCHSQIINSIVRPSVAHMSLWWNLFPSDRCTCFQKNISAGGILESPAKNSRSLIF